MLTGMGRDGCDGLVELRASGGLVLAQDPGTCVVASMPQAVIGAGAATLVGTVALIAKTLVQWSSR
jgi:two-component system chemotaxis response regulator CheB